MKQTAIKFVDAEDTSNTGLVADKLLDDEEVLKEWRLRFPEWGSPKLTIKLKVMVRDGKKCCSKPAPAISP
jgi:hypothetical protein